MSCINVNEVIDEISVKPNSMLMYSMTKGPFLFKSLTPFMDKTDQIWLGQRTRTRTKTYSVHTYQFIKKNNNRQKHTLNLKE